ncbi:MAG: hypothetical protein F9K16_01050 [Thermoanaerobaculia bacterium]|nr:MAG: hypothetical protein F9K16_01050 [Thermoanaerobaculia bacterium]MBZ0102556.1 hypothetical protein [Thermoanaerobaculia bacterium]
MHRAFGWTLALAVLSTSAALGQGTITDPPATFVRGATPWDTSPAANFTGVSATLSQDHLFETGWWFRVAGDTQETAFSVPDSQDYTGSSSTIHWNDVAGRGLFAATENTSLYDTTSIFGFASGYVATMLSIENLSSQDPLELEIFHLADFDLAGPGSDSAAWRQYTPYSMIELTDPSGNVAYYLSPHPWTGFLVRPWSTATGVAALLSDAAVTDFDNSGLPFGPGDFTGGWQYSLTLPPGGSDFVGVYLMVNSNAYCFNPVGVFCDGFEGEELFFWSSSIP